ncbi:PepSY domain-containing protein [Aurantiacibacter xanthus]|uniref:PepSY domain-containing protein n=1 Tax=Aurantiacibacter xanthus TaxID=1784712 RepID=A0A3A1P7P6_9SPHN|nr:PepSY-associated TM helix domain-containing protein [Aurantiacibacter xanthus]RIV86111.1 PepSY domain-containing protein [Aurantiacibacter xanthus]
MATARASLGAPAQRAKPAPKAARLWWQVHQWVGLKLSLFMAFILFTGTLAVVSQEIDWLAQPAFRVSPSSVEGPVAWPQIAENAAAYPGVSAVSIIEAPPASAFAARVSVTFDDERAGFLYAHPSTGDIQGTGPWAGAARVLRNLHRHLNLPTKIGVPIVASLAILLLISLVSSFVVYKRWWRGFAKPLRRRDARTWWGDFHRLSGVWSLWFVALISLTGIWYLAESLGLDAPPQSRFEAAADGPPLAEGSLATAFAAGIAAQPGLRIEAAMLPDADNPMLELQGQYEAMLVRPRANAVWVDVRDNRVKLITDGRDLTVHQRISEMADPLHFGTFGGYWTKALWFLFGLLLTGLSLSGAAIYSLRIARERGTAPRLSTAFAGMWTGAGRWRWLSIGLIGTGLVMIGYLVVSG